MNEREILTEDKRILIPDRLVFDEKRVTIIDYKTGLPNKNHHQQLRNYSKSLYEMGYLISKMILVYMNDEISFEEV